EKSDSRKKPNPASRRARSARAPVKSSRKKVRSPRAKSPLRTPAKKRTLVGKSQKPNSRLKKRSRSQITASSVVKAKTRVPKEAKQRKKPEAIETAGVLSSAKSIIATAASAGRQGVGQQSRSEKSLPGETSPPPERARPRAQQRSPASRAPKYSNAREIAAPEDERA